MASASRESVFGIDQHGTEKSPVRPHQDRFLPSPSCTTGTAVPYRGAWYCPGTALGIYDNAYGMNTRVVLKDTIASTSGTTAKVQIVIPCRASYCGALIKYDYITLYFTAQPTPKALSVLTASGVTRNRGLNVVGYVVTGTASPGCGALC
jgi:hypothetical protein